MFEEEGGEVFEELLDVHTFEELLPVSPRPIDTLKLDLHTHVFEEFLPMFPQAITLRSVERLVEKIKAMGLDGIAITEHHTKAYGYRVKEIVESHFNNEVLIIPGREVETWESHIVELDLPCHSVVTFRFLAHPGYPTKIFDNINSFNGIEVENALHNWGIDHAETREIAAEHNLIMLTNSDAHYLRDVGRYYNEVSMEELCQKAMSTGHTASSAEPASD